MNERYQPLACSLYDHLEVACLYGYQLRVELRDGSELQAQAITTRSVNKEEFLLLRNASGEHLLRLDQFLAITPLNEGAQYGRIELSSSPQQPS
ncbi:Rho-binding antiterminator [Pseudomonas sp. Marseille-Q8238]